MDFFKNQNKRSSLKKNIFYAAVIFVVLGLSFAMTCCSFKNFTWKNVFENAGVSDVTTETSELEMSVHFLNVGKADCTYIKCGDKNILIDAADKEPSNTVTEYLKRQNVSKLDLVVVSHPHRDHIGQMDKVIKQFKIEKFIEPDVPEKIIPTSRSYENMLRALSSKKVSAEYAKPGKSFNVGKAKIEILGPISQNDNINNNSVVLKIIYGDVSFLFMGDAEKAEESDLVKSKYNLKSTVLKVGHHGSLTSSTQNFLKKVSPKYAVISVATDRSNLPKEKIINRLCGFCEKIYRTDKNGTVIFLTDGKKIEVKTEKSGGAANEKAVG